MAADEVSKHLMLEWTRWAGRGNGPIADLVSRGIDFVFDALGFLSGTPGTDFSPKTIRGRVSRCRRGGYETTPGAWRDLGGRLTPVKVVFDGDELSIQGETLTLSLASFIPIGILDYPARPRATDPKTGTELESGMVFRADDRVAELLLLRKSELAVIAILARWPSPADLPHGQNAAEITSPTL